MFIAEKGQQSYWEFNFSPSGEWAAYALKSYRDGGPIEDDGLHPEIVVRSAANSFELEAIVRLDRLQAVDPKVPLRMGLSAVIEENDGTISYWALKHPPGKPDFHHPDSFALELALPDQSA
ncbi:MAG: DOMON-like domain-containing protein [Deltaproteobacteria bacterium]|nr:DOMON-like domain-containing protein [Deltaproteobacteria bacterium]